MFSKKAGMNDFVWENNYHLLKSVNIKCSKCWSFLERYVPEIPSNEKFSCSWEMVRKEKEIDSWFVGV